MRTVCAPAGRSALISVNRSSYVIPRLPESNWCPSSYTTIPMSDTRVGVCRNTYRSFSGVSTSMYCEVGTSESSNSATCCKKSSCIASESSLTLTSSSLNACRSEVPISWHSALNGATTTASFVRPERKPLRSIISTDRVFPALVGI